LVVFSTATFPPFLSILYSCPVSIVPSENSFTASFEAMMSRSAALAMLVAADKSLQDNKRIVLHYKCEYSAVSAS
jgi:hypothetical protein